MKVLVNYSYGGFSLSTEASEMLNKLKGKEVIDPKYGYCWDIKRWDKEMVEVYETLGYEKFNGRHAKVYLEDVNEPFIIDEYDGYESIQTLSDFNENATNPDDFKVYI
jgi:hypothetical protein